MIFQAPVDSLSHRALLDAASMAGEDRDALKRLLWLINAHPTLVAHVRVFENLLAHIDSPLCNTESLSWAKEWKVDIPAWHSICAWISKQKTSLSHLVGLELFDEQPRSELHNPHLNSGVGRHGVVAALWSRHQSVDDYPPPSDLHHAAAARYFQLQAHLFVSYADARFCLSQKHANLGQSFYESYALELEAPIAPALTASIGLAVREFSWDRYAALIAQFPANKTMPEFCTALAETDISTEVLSRDCQEDAIRYLHAIRRYFRRSTEMRSGWFPLQVRRHGGGGGTGHRRRPGFVHFTEVAGVYISDPPPPPDDEDIPHPVESSVLIDCDWDLNDDPAAVESSGLSPAETLEEAFRLYTPQELGGRLAAARRQRLATEMQAQFLPFDYVSLTATEMRRLHSRAQSAISTYLFESPDNLQRARHQAIAALMIKVMWFFGQSCTSARKLRFVWQTGPDVSEANPPEVDDITLLLIAPSRRDWSHTRVGGFWVPAISPDYKTSLPEGLEEVGRPPCSCFLLPDLFGLGDELIDFLHKESRPNDHVFGIEPKPAEKAIKLLIAECSEERLSADKVSLSLGHILMSQTGDQSIVWIVTSDRDRANEPRMHYTRHSVPTLLRAYANAAHQLGRDLGIRLKPWNAPPLAGSEDAPSPGARFVLRLAELRELVSGLTRQLKDHRREPFTRAGILQYHHAYVLFTWLFQSLHTTIRAISRPNSLYKAWEEQHDKKQALTVSLSDKDGRYSNKSRLVSVGEGLGIQFSYYHMHIESLIKRLGLRFDWRDSKDTNLPLLAISESKELIPLTPSWIEGELARRFAPIPANFHRGFLRTELLERACSAEAVDAFLGHANHGESPFGRYSSFDYGLHRQIIEKALGAIHEDLNLRPVPSRIVPYTTRAAHA